ncbi:GGDEF domain-containing protein [Agrobacterium sp. a22-2]|uniref:GGDEF domain-containing protein n=1 Tax=Agrobacterium sp. a22-2 TaxID=2283840 RepID=UPI00144584FD|nr:GGDEF domain-containing protein [Agrobacterium sp. a22-2]
MLDIKTGFILWSAQALTVAGLLAAVWLHDRSQRHYAGWSAGFAAHGLGVALVALRGHIPNFISIEFANTLALSCFFFWAYGLRQFDGRSVPPYAAIPALLWIAGMLLPPIHDNLGYRVALYNFGAATGFFILALTAYTGQFSSHKRRRLISAIWCVQATSCLAGAIANTISPPQTLQGAQIFGFTGIVAIFCFVTSLLIGARIMMDRSEQKLQQLVRTDPLTGVLNRRGIIDAFGEIRGTASAAQPPMIAQLLFDLDHFKQINDLHGHQAGDCVLIAFSAIGQKIIGALGVFGRSGGEEFSAILRTGTVREAARLAEAIRQQLAQTNIDTPKGPVQVTVSIGISVMPARTADLDQLMSGADRALYKAKAMGRNRTAVLRGDAIVCIPAADRAGTADEIDLDADRQVTALRRVVGMTTGDRDTAAT